MDSARKKLPIDSWNGESIHPGETKNIYLPVSQTSSGATIYIPIQIRRGLEDGPVLFVSAALHGDEINGTGAIRQLIQDTDLKVLRGSLILVPVLNILAFENRSRYMPDRRDLNRCFPGLEGGSLASRMAHSIFQEVVTRSDYGIDLHTAAVQRTNYPTVRGTMADEEVGRIARAFGSEIILNKSGPKNSLRQEACRVGCATILMEGGEVWKVESGIVQTITRGVLNVLRELKMIDGAPVPPDYQIVIDKTRWVRAEFGGFLQFHIKPGQLVEKGQPLTTNTSLLGEELGVLHAPFDGVVVGLTTLPTVSPGEPVCHVGRLPKGKSISKLRALRAEEYGLEERVADELAANLLIVERDDPE